MQRLGTIIGALLVIGGAALAGWAVANLPGGAPWTTDDRTGLLPRIWDAVSPLDPPLDSPPTIEYSAPTAATELAEPSTVSPLAAGADSLMEPQAITATISVTDAVGVGVASAVSGVLTQPVTNSITVTVPPAGETVAQAIDPQATITNTATLSDTGTANSEPANNEPGVDDSAVPFGAADATLENVIDAGAAGDPAPELVIAASEDLPTQLISALIDLDATETNVDLVARDVATATVGLGWNATGGVPFFRQFFAAATRFDTLDTTLTRDEVETAWQAPTDDFAQVVYLAETAPALVALLGEPGEHVTPVDGLEGAIEASWGITPTLALLPFEQLHPRLTVLSIEGQNPVENANRFSAGDYPLTAIVYIEGRTGSGQLTREQAALLQRLSNTNRDPALLTVVAATGVTAMTRYMAAEMETRGYSWPAEVVGEELASADITVISNEVPFVEDCEPNTTPDNLVFCSKPEYMQTLLDSGVTIVGLTGNHQNDFGWRGMADSLEIYAEYGIPVYGGGADLEQATAPLYMEHNGNRLAFLGVNSFGPPSAWATATSPGSAPYDLVQLSATIRNIKEQGLADLVLAEFQYLEYYEPTPLGDQVIDFRAVMRAGADIVTGVQSHVPQGMEFFNPLPVDADSPLAGTYTGERLILYGLGNLYFDQMWQEQTRDNMFVKHTIYAGRHLSTQIFTTVLHDFGQPRWADPVRRATILERVFGASTFAP